MGGHWSAQYLTVTYVLQAIYLRSSQHPRGRQPDSSEKFIADRIHIIMATTQQQQHMAEE